MINGTHSSYMAKIMAQLIITKQGLGKRGDHFR